MPSRELLNRRSARLLALAIAATVVIFDQITKAWAHSNLAGRTVDVIDGFFRFALAENTGAAFSSFKGMGPIIGVMDVGVGGFLLYLIEISNRRAELIAYSLILGGAFGNLFDRIFRGNGFLDGPVVDWIVLWTIPNFNIADSAVTIGVGLLIVASLFHRDG